MRKAWQFILIFSVFSILHLYVTTLSAAQIIIFPFVVLFLFNLKIYERRLPRSLLALALIVAMLSALVLYTYKTRDRLTFFVASLVGDEYESASRIFRENITKQIPKQSGISLVRVYRAFKAEKEVVKDAKGDASARPYVWGDKRTIRVNFPGEKVFVPLKAGLNDWLDAMQLKVIESVSGLSLAFEPQRETSLFLAEFFAGLLGKQEREIFLRSSASLTALWRSYAHRAYPLWVLGNLHSFNGLGFGKYQSGELECAMQAYENSRGYLRTGQNDELYAASLNNEAVILLIRAQKEGKRQYRDLALRFLKKAKKSLNLPQYKIKFAEQRETIKVNLKVVKGPKKRKRIATKIRTHKAPRN